ncbi:hypothetical protein [Roseateles puraquae]|uniref:hypothetical protein n=1 Tax=Roseateles puraquae TaxID=431059 RepID=UPI0031D245B9
MPGTQTELGYGSLRATTSVINAHSSGGTSQTFNVALNARALLSGALSAGVLSTILNIPSGAGRLSLCALSTVDSTTRTARLRITADGVVVFDATTASISGTGVGIFAAGFNSGSNTLSEGDAIVYTRSLKVEAASSLTETDKLTLFYMLKGM